MQRQALELSLFSNPSGYYDTRTIASFHTTTRSDGNPVPPSNYPTVPPTIPGLVAPYATQAHWRGDPAAIQGITNPVVRLLYETGWSWLDNFLGAWDVAVSQDSGLVYSTLGPVTVSGSTPPQERLLTAAAFRVHQGHVHRYWDATPFPASSPNAPTATGPGFVPRLVMLHGLPRENQGILIGDENSGKYAQTDGQGRPLKYEYTLLFSTVVPPGNGGSNPASTGGVQWDPDPQSTTNNLVWLNVWDPGSATQWIRRQGPDAPSNPAIGWFLFPTVLSQGTRWYLQLLVQEYVVLAGSTVATKTGRFAASRGHWFGVARP